MLVLLCPLYSAYLMTVNQVLGGTSSSLQHLAVKEEGPRS